MPTKSGPALLKVKNPDGSFENLIIDVHSKLKSPGPIRASVTDEVSRVSRLR
jgi:endoglucanase